MQTIRLSWIALLLLLSVVMGCSGTQDGSDDATAPTEEKQSEQPAPEGGPKMIPPTVSDENG